MPLAALPVALAVSAGASAATGIASSVIGANAAGNAADTQAAAAEKNALLQKQEADQALQFQEQQFGQTEQNESPFITAGQGAVTNLASLLGVLSPEQLSSPAPTSPAAAAAASAAKTPISNYEGQSFGSLTSSGDPNVSPNKETTQQWKAQGIPFQNITTTDGRTVAVRSTPATAAPAAGAPGAPAASGTSPTAPLSSLVNPSLGAPGSLSQPWTQQFTAPTDVTEQNDPGYQFRLSQGQQALERSAAAKGGLLSGGETKDLTDYEQGAASNEYSNVYNRSLQQYQQSYNQFQQNQANQYNRLANLAGLGQVSAGNLNSAATSTAGQVGNTLLTAGAQQAQQGTNAAAATASGYAGGANAITTGLGGISGGLSQSLLLNSLLAPKPSPDQGVSANNGSQIDS